MWFTPTIGKVGRFQPPTCSPRTSLSFVGWGESLRGRPRLVCTVGRVFTRPTASATPGGPRKDSTHPTRITSAVFSWVLRLDHVDGETLGRAADRFGARSDDLFNAPLECLAVQTAQVSFERH